MAAFARHEPGAPEPVRVTDLHVAPGPTLAKFSVARGPKQYAIDVTDHLWAPGAFIPMARELVGAGASASVLTGGDALLKSLTDPTPAAIQAQNARLSLLLRDNPRSAALHDRAALLMGALALRENAATMSDARRMMCRMTAHLAIARALDPAAPTSEGRLANLVLLALVNRQRDVIAQLDEMDKGERSPELAAWSRALRLRVTKDWRLIGDPAAATLLEQRELVRAAHSAVGNNKSLPMLDAVQSHADVTDWSRAILHERPSVESGNRFAGTSLALELREAADVRSLYPHPPANWDHTTVLRELNVEPTAGPATFGPDAQFWIIDWGTWAAASERHIAAGIVCASRHFRQQLAMPEEAADFEQKSRDAFQELRLYPLVERYIAQDAKNAGRYLTAAAAAAAFTRANPTLVTDGAWTDLFEKPAFAPLAANLPLSGPWFQPYFIAGTGFDSHRVYGFHWQIRVAEPELDALRTMAPYESNFVLPWIDKRFGHEPAVDDVKRAAGTAAEYNTWFAWKVANAATTRPDVYVPLVRTIAETMEPDSWYWVGVYLAEHEREDEAEAAFQHYYREGQNRVGVANRMDWQIVHLFRTGRQAQALALAKDGADVFSFFGLTYYADALDRSGDVRGAERIYRTVIDRYAPSGKVELLAFLLRHQSTNAQYRREADELLSQGLPTDGVHIFEKGMEAVDRSRLSGPPDAGARITFPSAAGLHAGLRKGDIIVGIDGTRIRGSQEYYVMKFQSWAPSMRFLVWRDNGYFEVNTGLRHRWINSGIETYRQ